MKTRKVTEEVSIEYGEDTYTAEVTWEYWKENYGEDADGNRGVMMNMCEVADIQNIKKNGTGISIELVASDIVNKLCDAEPKGE